MGGLAKTNTLESKNSSVTSGTHKPRNVIIEDWPLARPFRAAYQPSAVIMNKVVCTKKGHSATVAQTTEW